MENKTKWLLGGAVIGAVALGAVVASKNPTVRAKAKEIVEHEKVQAGVTKTKEITKKAADKSKEVSHKVAEKGKEVTQKAVEKGKDLVKKEKPGAVVPKYEDIVQ